MRITGTRGPAAESDAASKKNRSLSKASKQDRRRITSRHIRSVTLKCGLNVTESDIVPFNSLDLVSYTGYRVRRKVAPLRSLADNSLVGYVHLVCYALRRR